MEFQIVGEHFLKRYATLTESSSSNVISNQHLCGKFRPNVNEGFHPASPGAHHY
jgi:hypothetical protein